MLTLEDDGYVNRNTKCMIIYLYQRYKICRRIFRNCLANMARRSVNPRVSKRQHDCPRRGNSSNKCTPNYARKFSFLQSRDRVYLFPKIAEHSSVEVEIGTAYPHRFASRFMLARLAKLRTKFSDTDPQTRLLYRARTWRHKQGPIVFSGIRCN
jgi:hypothetical protein